MRPAKIKWGRPFPKALCEIPDFHFHFESQGVYFTPMTRVEYIDTMTGAAMRALPARALLLLSRL